MNWRRLGRYAGLGLLAVALPVALAGLAYRYALFDDNSGYLAGHRLADGPLWIGDGAEQSSGLAFDTTTGLLYAVNNAPPRLYVLTADGHPLRAIELQGFDDTEAVAALGQGLFAVVSERIGAISWFQVDAQTRSVQLDPRQSVRLFERPVGNVGLEGLSFDAGHGLLYAVKERRPRRIYALAWPVTDSARPAVHNPWDAEDRSWWSTASLSGIHYQPGNGHLFVLSRRSRRITEYTPSGEEVGHFALKAGSGGLHDPIDGAEGITMDADGTLYICAEGNRLYIFRRAP